MSKAPEYKSMIIDMAVELAKKDSISIYFSSENLTAKLRAKLELTGDPTRDVANCIYIIKEMVSDMNRDCL